MTRTLRFPKNAVRGALSNEEKEFISRCLVPILVEQYLARKPNAQEHEKA
jgi:hypothetical protein